MLRKTNWVWKQEKNSLFVKAPYKLTQAPPTPHPPIQTYVYPHLTSESSVQSALFPSCCAELIASVTGNRKLGERNVFAQHLGQLPFRNSKIKMIQEDVSHPLIHRGTHPFNELGLQARIKDLVFGRKNVFFSQMVQGLDSTNSLLLKMFFMLSSLLTGRWTGFSAHTVSIEGVLLCSCSIFMLIYKELLYLVANSQEELVEHNGR